ncbi:acyl carrier protein [Amycolatopsis jejuensis]|uniref:acyl carrier protein n=1 Tax=Amycolatopsis jejuensis TaxID=330084 RepID=UPI0005250807|nr:acyl carrier protein [Amycolatopsis jejuensis]
MTAELTTSAVRDLLQDEKLVAHLPAELTDDTELTFDSLSLVWLLHLVEQRHGLVVPPSDEAFAECTSVRGITEWLQGVQAGRDEP